MEEQLNEQKYGTLNNGYRTDKSDRLLINFDPDLLREKYQKRKNWKGRLKDGTVVNQEDLVNILKEHSTHLSKDGKKNTPTDLSGAILIGVDLSGAELVFADMSDKGIEAYFQSEVAIPGGAYLKNANLSNTNLSSANLSKANLSKADLSEADLSDAILHGTNIGKAFINNANLSGAKLFMANLSGAQLKNTNMKRAILLEANLSKTHISNANLNGAYLRKTDMQNAILSGTDLSKANLTGANLSGTYMGYTNLSKTIFEPNEEFVEKIIGIADADNLSELTYRKSPTSLVILREKFRKAGLRRQEREVTYAIKHTQIEILWIDDSWSSKIEAAFNYLFFDLTCRYGMTPGQPLKALICLIPFFSVFYVLALRTRKPKTGIWLILPKNRLLQTTKKVKPIKLTTKFPPRITQIRKFNKIKFLIKLSYRIIRIALYFSLLSATTIGWREFNVGNWLFRLQRREYTLSATGWVRTVSGMQSLISVYLLALWVLTYFGRPF